jgi:hypothetical protein
MGMDALVGGNGPPEIGGALFVRSAFVAVRWGEGSQRASWGDCGAIVRESSRGFPWPYRLQFLARSAAETWTKSLSLLVPGARLGQPPRQRLPFALLLWVLSAA